MRARTLATAVVIATAAVTAATLTIAGPAAGRADGSADPGVRTERVDVIRKEIFLTPESRTQPLGTDLLPGALVSASGVFDRENIDPDPNKASPTDQDTFYDFLPGTTYQRAVDGVFVQWIHPSSGDQLQLGLSQLINGPTPVEGNPPPFEPVSHAYNVELDALGSPIENPMINAPESYYDPFEVRETGQISLVFEMVVTKGPTVEFSFNASKKPQSGLKSDRDEVLRGVSAVGDGKLEVGDCVDGLSNVKARGEIEATTKGGDDRTVVKASGRCSSFNDGPDTRSVVIDLSVAKSSLGQCAAGGPAKLRIRDAEQADRDQAVLIYCDRHLIWRRGGEGLRVSVDRPSS